MDCNYTFVIKKDLLKKVYPDAISPGFVETEIILRAKYLKSDVKSIETNYNRRKFGKPHFGRLNDVLLTIFDIIKFRIYSLVLILRQK